LLVAVALLCGCRGKPPSRANPATTNPSILTGLSSPRYIVDLQANAVPPDGWKPDPEKSSENHSHQTWISPSGHTAYGIIRFRMPLPVGHDWALWGFLREMKKNEGESTLLWKSWDASLPGLRFVAEGGMYVVRTNLFVSGCDGWACYAGTLRKETVVPDELALAERAREATTFSVDAPTTAPATAQTLQR
jgi:hypothetical protein